MDNTKSNPNDFKVVKFTNSTDFTFTPEMGCMFDGRPISGISGEAGIKAGESMTLPYHVGNRLATNLAKVVKVKRAPIKDEENNPLGKPLWSDEDLEALKKSFLTDLYTEERPVIVTETDRLMAKVEEYKAMVDALMKKEGTIEEKKENTVETTDASTQDAPSPRVFADKQEVLAELESRGIKHDKRASKANLEELLK